MGQQVVNPEGMVADSAFQNSLMAQPNINIEGAVNQIQPQVYEANSNVIENSQAQQVIDQSGVNRDEIGNQFQPQMPEVGVEDVFMPGEPVPIEQSAVEEDGFTLRESVSTQESDLVHDAVKYPLLRGATATGF